MDRISYDRKEPSVGTSELSGSTELESYKGVLPLPITPVTLLHVLSPVIAIVAGIIATWLFAHFPALHVLGSADSAARIIAEALVFLVTALGTYLVHYKLIDAAVQFKLMEPPMLAANVDVVNLHTETHALADQLAHVETELAVLQRQAGMKAEPRRRRGPAKLDNDPQG